MRSRSHFVSEIEGELERPLFQVSLVTAGPCRIRGCKLTTYIHVHTDGSVELKSRSQTPAESWMCVLRMVEQTRLDTSRVHPMFGSRSTSLNSHGDALFGLTKSTLRDHDIRRGFILM